MHPFPAAMMMQGLAGGFTSYSQVITSNPGSYQNIPVPAGATSAVLEAIGAGAGSSYDGNSYFGGGGASYAKTTISLAGVTQITVLIGASSGANPGQPTFMHKNSSTGPEVCTAGGGRIDHNSGENGNSVGDTISYGERGGLSGLSGGAAAGPNGLGVAPAGARQTNGTAPAANLYGAGKASDSATYVAGAQGWARITWR